MPIDHEFITPTERNQCQVHLTSEQVHGEMQQCSHMKEKSNQESHSDREGLSLAHRGENEAPSRLSGSENAARLALEEQRDHPLAEAKSEVLKQECRADFLDCSIRELQRQIHSSRTEIDHTNLVHETSRREKARLHEELAQREGALRETRRMLQASIEKVGLLYKNSLHKYRSCRIE